VSGAVASGESAAPAWFATAVADRAEAGATVVDGCPVAHLRWGQPGAPGLVLLHGGAAHARWWDHLGPLLAAGGRHDVLAVDLSGHGDSGWRERYSLEGWAAEVLAVVDAVGMAARPVVIGHSMGGFVAIDAAAGHGDELGGAIVVDSPVRRPDPESQEARGGRLFRRPKTYPELDEALRHFVLVPPQPPPPRYVHDHVARHSLHEVAGGWTWKFDPALWAKRPARRDADYADKLSRVRCRLAVVHGQRSGIVDASVTDYMAERLGRRAPFVEIPEAHHHLILDQPLAFVAAVRALLADWAAHPDPHLGSRAG
jgi:pimeloyl-ACP methyl ester carboxylesterase